MEERSNQVRLYAEPELIPPIRPHGFFYVFIAM